MRELTGTYFIGETFNVEIESRTVFKHLIGYGYIRLKYNIDFVNKVTTNS